MDVFKSYVSEILCVVLTRVKSKAAMEALGGRGGIAPTHS
jgi:hypothetical protein